jgi:sigma-B regulation protein RsbU (phosphoserine phosphatase)
MRYVRAGHDLPIHFRPQTGQLSLLQAPGRFLGLLDGLILDEAAFQLVPGDVLVCYSDGLTDAESSDGVCYGLERLKALVAGVPDQPAQATAETIIADVEAFRSGAPQPDDLTLLVMKVQ